MDTEVIYIHICVYVYAYIFMCLSPIINKRRSVKRVRQDIGSDREEERSRNDINVLQYKFFENLRKKLGHGTNQLIG